MSTRARFHTLKFDAHHNLVASFMVGAANEDTQTGLRRGLGAAGGQRPLVSGEFDIRPMTPDEISVVERLEKHGELLTRLMAAASLEHSLGTIRATRRTDGLFTVTGALYDCMTGARAGEVAIVVNIDQDGELVN